MKSVFSSVYLPINWRFFIFFGHALGEVMVLELQEQKYIYGIFHALSLDTTKMLFPLLRSTSSFKLYLFSSFNN